MTQAELAGALKIHQPDVSNLLNGRVSRFSVGKPIQFAGKLDLDAQIKFIKRKPPRTVSLKAEGAKRENAVA